MIPTLAQFIRSQNPIERLKVDAAVDYADNLYEQASAIQDDNPDRARYLRGRADWFLSSL